MKIFLKTLFFLTVVFCWNSNIQGQTWSTANLNQNTYRDGNVGIGLTTPQAKLHLSKTTQESAIITGDPIPSLPTYFPHIRFNNFVEKGGMVTNSNVWDINALNNFSLSTISSSSVSPKLKMSLSDQGDITFYGNRLAIGDGTIKFTTGKGNSLFGLESYHLGFGISGAASSSNGTTFVFPPQGTGGSIIQGDADGNLLFISKQDDGDPTIASSENLDYTKMMIKGNGKVSIGTDDTPNFPASSQNYLFYVNGGILSKEVRVRTDWADYVFEKNYSLLPLKKVENFIKENGHLPNTPSAEEIQANGLELGKITTNQQEKIEELFLHLIEMEKRMVELEKENKILKEKISK
ncbi:MAG: hypothetical protein AB8H03_03060 [Saprospiraceae bacterium]